MRLRGNIFTTVHIKSPYLKHSTNSQAWSTSEADSRSATEEIVHLYETRKFIIVFCG
jgi:hypothetical protein